MAEEFAAFTLQQADEIMDMVRRVKSLRVTGARAFSNNESGITISIPHAQRPSAPPIPVRLTGHRSGYPDQFSFQEVYWNDTNGAYADKTGGMTNSTHGYLRERLGRRAIPISSRVVQFIELDSARAASNGAGPYVFTTTRDWILAQVIGNATLGSTGARWTYSWVESRFNGTSVETVSGGLSGTTSTNYALNLNGATITLAKSGTTAWYVDGVQANSTTASSAYPTGFHPRPTGGGGTSDTHKLNALVRLSEDFDANGSLVFFFADKMNHDGTCT